MEKIVIIVIAVFIGYLMAKRVKEQFIKTCKKCKSKMEISEVNANWTRLVCYQCGNKRYIVHSNS